MRKATATAVGALLVSTALILPSPAASAPSAGPGSPTTAPGTTVSASAVAAADRALTLHPGAVRASAGDSLGVHSTRVDADGAAHVRYTRTYRGLPVYGGDIIVHTTASGAFDSASVGLVEPLTVDTRARVSATRASRLAEQLFAGTRTKVYAPELFVDASSGKGRLAWRTRIDGWAPDGQTPSRFFALVDAVTGERIGSYDEINNIAGTGHSIYSGTVTVDTTLSGSLYQMVDPSHGNGTTCDMNNGTSTCTTFTDTDNIWGNGTQSNRQSAAVDAHYGAAMTFDYFKNVHGRNGIFGNGAGVPSRVHYGSNYVNAFWDGSRMTYGDGASNSRPLVSLDVAGHEMSHGVTANVVPGGLTYSGESGGLNEATSDIFGNMVEFYANNPNDPGDYQVGEKININGNGTPLRYMYNPGLDGASHTCWSSSTPGAGVHYSSGVANHFYFMLAEGSGATPYGTSPVCGSAPAVTGIGRAKAERIWWRALDVYFTSNTSYVNTSNPANTARAYTLRAATDLYGNCSTEYKTVQAAWTAVNVAGSDPTCGTGGGPVAGSQLWLRADAGVTSSAGKVSSWADQSGTGRHATMTTSSRQPTLVSGALNGQPVVRFSGAQSLLLASAVNPTSFTIHVVGKNSRADESYSMILGPSGSGPNNQLRWENSSQLLVHGSGNALPTTTSAVGNTKAYHLLTLRYDGSALRVYRNGTLMATHSFAVSGSWVLSQVGAYYSSAFMTGDLAEVLVYPSALSDAGRTGNDTYLKTKYGLS